MDVKQFVMRALLQQTLEIALCRSGQETCRAPATAEATDEQVTYTATIAPGVAVGDFNEIAVYRDGELIRKKNFPMEHKHAADKADVQWTVTVGEATD